MSSFQTTHEIKTVFYTWTIENYEFLHDVGRCNGLTSPMFLNNGSGLAILLAFCESTHKYFTGIEVGVTANSIKHDGKVQFGFGKCPGSFDDNIITWKNNQGNNHNYISLPNPGGCNTAFFQTAFLKKSASENDGKLIVNCKIAYLGQRTDSSGPHDNLINVSNCQLAEDLGAMLNTKELADVTIVTADGQKISVHKNILSARSKVFAAMFKHQMQENTENCVAIEDFSFDVVSELIRFMYTGEAPNLNLEMSAELLAAADKYGLKRLKWMCAKLMSDNLSVENAHAVLKSADVYNFQGLKLRTIKFIQTSIEKESSKTKYDDFFKVLMEQKFQELSNPAHEPPQKNMKLSGPC